MLRGATFPRAPVVTVLWLVTLMLFGCARLEPPELTPRSVEVVRVGPTGMTVRLDVDVHNPNRLGLAVQAVSATLKLDNQVPLGRASVERRQELRARKTTRVTSELRIPWGNLIDAVALAKDHERIPYTLEGHARIGGRLSVEVPFTIQGVVTGEQLLKATVSGLPSFKLP